MEAAQAQARSARNGGSQQAVGALDRAPASAAVGESRANILLTGRADRPDGRVRFPSKAAGSQRGASISSIGPVLPRARPSPGRGLLRSQRRQLQAQAAPWLPAAAPGVYAAVVALVLLLVLVAGFFPLTVSSTQPGPLLRASQVSLPGTAGAAGWARPASPS